MEYEALVWALCRAIWRGHQRICVQTDSLLVANQARCVWACRSQALRGYYEDVQSMLATMESRGMVVIVEHVYREYNTIADSLANKAVDSRGSRG